MALELNWSSRLPSNGVSQSSAADGWINWPSNDWMRDRKITLLIPFGGSVREID